MWYIATAVIFFGLGGWLWPKLRLQLLSFRADPMGVIRADIAKLEAAKDKLLGKGVEP